jgi:outer membrane protein OmpA-like peptidoglycan-associated protein
MKKASIFIFSLLILSSCAKNPYTGEVEISHTAKYGASGAVLGAITGIISGKDRKSATRGALFGTIAGGALGVYFDSQEQILRKELSESGVGIERNKNQIRLIMPGNITFDFNDSNISTNFYKTLNSITKVFKKYKNTDILIEGFTDSVGSKSYNKALSMKRAKSVYDYFISQRISDLRIKVYGRGKSSPIATNQTSKGRQQNRRVEVRILPKK